MKFKHVAALALILTLCSSAFAASGKFYRFKGRLYRVFEHNLTWYDAKIRCEEMGGHLATITSRAENNFIVSICQNRRFYWLGGFRLNDGYGWAWVTGEPFRYTNWSPGEPNDADYGEPYLQITNYHTGRWGWNDHNDNFWPSRSLYCFICEWDDDSSRTLSNAEETVNYYYGR